MIIEESDIPRLLVDGIELFSLDYIYELRAADGGLSAGDWVSGNRAAISHIKATWYADLKIAAVEQIKLGATDSRTFAVKRVAVAYAYHLDMELGALVVGALFDPATTAHTGLDAEPRTPIAIDRLDKNTAHALREAEQSVRAIELEIVDSMSTAFGHGSDAFPLAHPGSWVTGFDAQAIVEALRRVSPTLTLPDNPTAALMQIASTHLRLIDYNARLAAAMHLVDALCDAESRGLLADLDECAHEAARAGARRGAECLEERMRAQGELVLAYVETPRHQFQAVLRGSKLLSEVVRL
jgi:hypothetical protein